MRTVITIPASKKQWKSFLLVASYFFIRYQNRAWDARNAFMGLMQIPWNVSSKWKYVLKWKKYLILVFLIIFSPYELNKKPSQPVFPSMFLLPLGECNLIFCCVTPTDSNFRQIKMVIIIVISHINIFCCCLFFY